ncbi:transmembrane protease serine 9-like [Anopheles stephensi]|uniref:transmembrane protease serine 9-like n=1 Tax=Anopheles stephensi TaxID=30069 RepID=UPI001658BA26|nr:transmembrane protease serine 9-like [Anopheles stephensi]
MYWQLISCLILCSVFCVVSETLGPNRLTCGKRKVKTIHLIHNGIDAKPGHWPWHAAIFHRERGKLQYACGGSIIDEETILTAAHCVFLDSGLIAESRIAVHVGAIHLNEESEFVQQHTVDEVIAHPGYNASRFMNDIALLKLTNNITMTEFVQPVCLWTMDSDQEEIVGKNGTLVGFGLNEKDVVSQVLKQAPIGVVDALTCIKSDRVSYANQLTSEMFCGGGQRGVSACNGDSGGGLFFNVQGKWFVRGVVSFIPFRPRTHLCDPSKFTAFTDVAKYMGWIELYVNARVLLIDTNELEVDYEEKLPLFNLNTCGTTTSDTVDANGKPTPLPWLGIAGKNSRDVKCVVTLVSEWYAVGPASCFQDGGKEMLIRFGGRQEIGEQKCFERAGTTVCTHPTQLRNVQQIIVHPRFTENAIYNDIALIELQTPADITQPNVKPICLPVTPALYTNLTTNLSVMSYSLAEDVYRDQIVNDEDVSECASAYKRAGLPVEEKSLCVTVPEEDLPKCNSIGKGAPLYERAGVDGGERYILRGLDILGITCTGTVSIVNAYLDLYAYLDWMLYNMKHNVVRTAEAEAANTSLAEWIELQQKPGNEKLRLFDMHTCGENVKTGETSAIIPWLGTLKSIENSTNLLESPGQSIVKAHETASLVVLISDRYALAPAHVFSEPTSWRSIILGLTRFNPLQQIECMFQACDAPYQEVQIRNITIHPEYNSRLHVNNLALIELLEPANTTKPYIRPICLPLTEKFRNSTPLELLLPTYIYVEQSTKLSPLDRLNCEERFAQEGYLVSVTDRARCAVLEKDYGEAAAVKSGVPLQTLVQVGEQQRYFLSGINSLKDLVNYHNPFYPYLFTDVNQYLDWILENMKLNDSETPSIDASPSQPVQVNPMPIRSTSRRRLFNFKTCGLYSKGTSRSAIYEAEPWSGFVFAWDPTYNSTSFTRCTAVLISEWYAVGVASCLDPGKKLFVQFGGYIEATGKDCYEHDGTTICRPKTYQVPVEKIIIHPSYSRPSYANDIVLIQLATPADISQAHVKPICLPVLDTVRSYNVSSMNTVAFGNSLGSFVFNKVDSRYINSTECQRRWDGMALKFQIQNTKHCVVNRRDPGERCTGDIFAVPGFALHSTQDLLGTTRYFLRGLLVVEPNLCSTYYPAIYTDVDVYLDWLLENMDERLNTLTRTYNLMEKLLFI